MMTWMPNMSLFDSAGALELDQLAVAMVESASLFNELIYDEPDPELGKAPAPLRLMWLGYETALAGYVAACSASLVAYGVSSSTLSLGVAQTMTVLRRDEDAPMVMPPWFTDTDVLRSHRSNLMRRWPDSYSWKGTPLRMPYLWPKVDDEGGYKILLSKYDKALLNSGDRSLAKSILKRVENL